MEKRDFEVKVGEHDLRLTAKNCAAVLFRSCVEVDYLAVELEEEGEETRVMRIFNNGEFVRYMAGYAPITEEGVVWRSPIRRDIEGQNLTFREVCGWNPVVIEKEQPSDWEMDMYLDLNAGDIDGEWKDLA